ncbi:NAD(P)-dependent oxidoreductase [Kitasatospora sp. NPDC053057]|uniref:NAD(P)-dependent oxidoreductase n=1 Tax=Kitasatospora sp. NPDC053057 TaxID=3364062 RepID=UPI0037CA1D7C
MTSIAFLGLGRMGSLMAGQLVKAGADVAVWNRTPDRAEPLVRAGAKEALTAADAVAGRDLVISMLSDPAAVEDVFLSPGGAAAALKPGSLVVEMSTIGPEAVGGLRRGLPLDARLVDGPVLGSLPQAAAGQLKIFLGGSAEDVESAREPLAPLGTVEHVGPLGSAAALKLILNSSTVSLFVLLGEVLAMADCFGLSTEHVLDALPGTGIGPFLDRIRGRIGDPAVATNFALGLAEKDLRLALADGTEDGAEAGLLAAARARLAAAVEAGLGDRDVSTAIGFLRGERIT